jgi:hypothetical protein
MKSSMCLGQRSLAYFEAFGVESLRFQKPYAYYLLELAIFLTTMILTGIEYSTRHPICDKNWRSDSPLYP